MARIITVADLREHVETDLPESAIQRLIDDADQFVVDTYGAHGPATQTDDLYVDSGSEYVFPTRPVDAITTVTEYTSETTSKVLDPTDYRLGHGSQSLLRLRNGSNPAVGWGYRVVVAYVIATTENPQRRGVVIDLVSLSINHSSGLRSERAGDYSVSYGDSADERNKILRRLGGVRVSI